MIHVLVWITTAKKANRDVSKSHREIKEERNQGNWSGEIG